MRTLAPIEIGVAATSIAIAFAIVLYAVIARVIVRPTSEWVLELPMELLVVATIYATGSLIAERRHLSVGILVERLPAIWQLRVAKLVNLTLAAVSAFLAQRAVVAALQASRAGLRVPELFGMPTALPLAVVAVGIALWCVHLLFAAAVES